MKSQEPAYLPLVRESLSEREAWHREKCVIPLQIAASLMSLSISRGVWGTRCVSTPASTSCVAFLESGSVTPHYPTILQLAYRDFLLRKRSKAKVYIKVKNMETDNPLRYQCLDRIKIIIYKCLSLFLNSIIKYFSVVFRLLYTGSSRSLFRVLLWF